MPAGRLAALLAICVVLACPPAGAQSEPTAEELLSQGKRALIDKDAPRARAAFEVGLAVAEGAEQRWRMMLGLALALELADDRLGAAYAYRRFLANSLDAPRARSEPWLGRRKSVLRDVDRLERDLLVEHARFDLQSDPPGARVIVDGSLSPFTTPAVIYLTGGQHELRLEREHFQPERLPLTVEPGLRALLHRKLVALSPSTAPSPPSPAPAPIAIAPTSQHEGPHLFAPGLLTLGGGVATLVVAGALHWAAARDAEEARGLAPTSNNIPRDDQLRARIADYQVGYATCYAIGGALAAAGAAMLIYDAVDPDEADPPAVGWVAPTPHGVAWGLSATW